jgi:hypothetical protein
MTCEKFPQCAVLHVSKNIKDKERLTMRFTRPSLQKIHKSIQFLFSYYLIIVAILLLLVQTSEMSEKWLLLRNCRRKMSQLKYN